MWNCIKHTFPSNALYKVVANLVTSQALERLVLVVGKEEERKKSDFW